MPIHNRFFLRPKREHEASPEGLASAGPLLQVQVEVPAAFAAYLAKKNQPVPTPGVGWALIDTGATRTCVDNNLLNQLGMQATGTVTTGTAAGPTSQLLYPAKLSVPGARLEIDFGSVIGVNLSGQSIAGQDVVVLLGRDVLSRCILVYNGPGGLFTLAL
jgi:predicted aspartyl protease